MVHRRQTLGDGALAVPQTRLGQLDALAMALSLAVSKGDAIFVAVRRFRLVLNLFTFTSNAVPSVGKVAYYSAAPVSRNIHVPGRCCVLRREVRR